MKTPIQELIAQVEEWMLYDKYVQDNPLDYEEYMVMHANQMIKVKGEFIDMCKSLLDVEKEQIMDAYMEGGDWEALPQPRFDNYFNQTFNTKER
jgi:hypothetical protein